MFTFEESHHLC